MGEKWKQLKKANRITLLENVFEVGKHYLVFWRMLYTEFEESVAVVDYYLYPFGIPQS